MADFTRLLGCWPVEDTVTYTGLKADVITDLAQLCGDYQVLPTGDPTIVTFADRIDALTASQRLGVPLAQLLDLAERIGFAPTRVFIAAAVPIRPAYQPPQPKRRHLKAVA